MYRLIGALLLFASAASAAEISFSSTIVLDGDGKTRSLTRVRPGRVQSDVNTGGRDNKLYAFHPTEACAYFDCNLEGGSVQGDGLVCSYTCTKERFDPITPGC